MSSVDCLCDADALFAGLPLAALLLDAEAVVVDANAGLLALLGCRADDVRGRHVAELFASAELDGLCGDSVCGSAAARIRRADASLLTVQARWNSFGGAGGPRRICVTVSADGADPAAAAGHAAPSSPGWQIDTSLDALVELTALLADSPLTGAQRELADTIAAAAEGLRALCAGSADAPPAASITAEVGGDETRLAGLRLLVAEDNAFNQIVVEQLLTRAGAAVVMAADGAAAIEALRPADAHFDAVLMDIQMPGMDGYAATRVIREELGRVDLPIIAVTAHAFPEDREKSRRAGMVAHLVKPLDVELLLELVARESRTTPPGAAAGEGAMPLPGLNVGAALEAFGGDEKAYAGLLHKFVALHRDDAALIRRLFDAGDEAAARARVHDLRGVSGILQLTELTRLAAELGRALRAHEAAALPALFAQLVTAMEIVQASIARFEASAIGA